MRFFLLFLFFLLPLSNSGLHAEETELHKRALAAGFKAAFVCSATFNGGKTISQIKADELSLIMPDYRPFMAALPEAVMNLETRAVSVSYAGDLPPRIAVWREHLGCAQLPIGGALENTGIVPEVNLERPNYGASEPWPQGDKFETPTVYNQKLEAVLSAAFDGETYGAGNRTTAVLVTTADRLIAEKYRPDFTPFTSQRTWSVAKSVAATVIGVAIEQGILDLKAPAPIPEWQAVGDPRQAITLEDLFHMSSGLYSGVAGNRTDEVYFGGGLVTDHATRNSLEAIPGERWKYANNDTMLLARALKSALGDDEAYLKFPFEQLFFKIGMLRTVPETDWQGNFVFSSQVWTTARDLGRLGILYLNDGVWNGERLLPEGWTGFVSTPAKDQPPLRRADGSAIMGYGGQFWLLNERLPNVPDDAFTAAGHRGQYMVVIPSENLVIVRRGYDESGGPRFQLDRFAEDILDALKTGQKR